MIEELHIYDGDKRSHDLSTVAPSNDQSLSNDRLPVETDKNRREMPVTVSELKGNNKSSVYRQVGNESSCVEMLVSGTMQCDNGDDGINKRENAARGDTTQPSTSAKVMITLQSFFHLIVDI